MTHVRLWSAQIFISENEDRSTSAEIRMRTDDRAEIVGHGRALRNPADTDVPEIGDELAVARALADLSSRLVGAAASDIEQVTHQPAHLTA